jgi:uncharacterized protein (TIGR03437 family)
LALGLFFLPAVLPGQTVTGPSVRFHTNLGDIDVTLLPDSAPATVANFLNYVNKGAFNQSIVHRLAKGFVWQGGGYQLVNHQPVQIPQDAPVVNEYAVSNIRGTLAMAKLDGDPNSATDQWFFNLVDNSANLNNANGGFTVFGRVANVASLSVMDQIAATQVYDLTANFGSGFDTFPLTGYNGTLQDANFVQVTSIVQLDAPPAAAGAVVSASAFGGFAAAAPGSYIEIYGSSLAGTTRGWAAADFTNGSAPTSLDGVTVRVNGQSAFVNFVSPGQVNAQIPATLPAGGRVPVVVAYQGQTAASLTLATQPLEPGLLAPALFNVAGKQYVAALHAASGAFVTNGSVPGIAAAPAIAGETLTIYGIGFGPVKQSNAPIAGQIAVGQTALSAAVQFTIGQTVAPVTYAGLAPGLVGVDQFNIVVPAGLASGDADFKAAVNGTAIAQTLVLPVQ